MPSFPIFVTQDGPDFYVWKDEAMTDLVMTRTCPYDVGMDLAKAEVARAWFIGLCSRSQIIRWPNPFSADGK